MKDKLERYDEIAIKLLKVGEALIMEGEDKEDYTILNIGNFIIFNFEFLNYLFHVFI